MWKPEYRTQGATPCSEVRKRVREPLLKNPRFLRRETGVRSGWVAGPVTELPPCTLTRGPKAQGAKRSFGWAPSVGYSQHRGRRIPEEGRVRRNPELPVLVDRGGAKAPSRGSVGHYTALLVHWKRPPQKQQQKKTSRSQPCSSSYCSHLKTDP